MTGNKPVEASWRGDETDALRRNRLNARAALAAAGTLNFKPVSSAKWVDVTERNGHIRVQIEHDTIRGVTPDMMKWWFEHLADKTTWNGKDFTGPEVSYYHLWHHRDHIAVTPLTSAPGVPNRGFQVDQQSRIDEQFNDYKDRIHGTMLTTRLDEEEFTFDILAFGTTAGHIIHRYHDEPGGLRFYAETVIRLDVPVVGGLLNRTIRPLLYNATSAEHWIRHNIEETGRSEHVIPTLYAAAKAMQQA
ncbi:MAG: hypothetical protein LBE61_13685 [Burkholderiaceae bacterium]|jgi:hypothetical protein|nr:hypothetical protein [Burkholderiaceae bacterium]